MNVGQSCEMASFLTAVIVIEIAYTYTCAKMPKTVPHSGMVYYRTRRIFTGGVNAPTTRGVAFGIEVSLSAGIQAKRYCLNTEF